METDTTGIVLVSALIENHYDVVSAQERADLSRQKFAESKSMTRVSIPRRLMSRCPGD